MNQADASPDTPHVLPGDSPVAVIGLGTMGHGIAQAFAVGGYSVRAIDERPETSATALDRIGSNLEQLADAGLLQSEQITEVLERITVCETLEATVDGALWVTEAAWENLEVKQQLFRKIEPLVDPQTILASNSSSFPITRTAGDLEHPQRAIVTHWFNPPHVIPVVEVVGGERTSEATVVTALATLEAIGKTAIRIDKELTGFLVNRVQVAMFREVFDLLDRGVATASEIDRAIRGSMGLRLAALGPLARHAGRHRDPRRHPEVGRRRGPGFQDGAGGLRVSTRDDRRDDCPARRRLPVAGSAVAQAGGPGVMTPEDFRQHGRELID